MPQRDCHWPRSCPKRQRYAGRVGRAALVGLCLLAVLVVGGCRGGATPVVGGADEPIPPAVQAALERDVPGARVLNLTVRQVEGGDTLYVYNIQTRDGSYEKRVYTPQGHQRFSLY